MARWISSEDAGALQRIHRRQPPAIATDLDGDHVFLAPSAFSLSWTQEKTPEIAFADIKAIDRS